MRTLGTQLVCTVEVADGIHVGAVWDGGPTISIFVNAHGQSHRACEWPIWNPDWNVPLIDTTRESFERFVVGRLHEPGVVEALVDGAACG